MYSLQEVFTVVEQVVGVVEDTQLVPEVKQQVERVEMGHCLVVVEEVVVVE